MSDHARVTSASVRACHFYSLYPGRSCQRSHTGKLTASGRGRGLYPILAVLTLIALAGCESGSKHSPVNTVPLASSPDTRQAARFLLQSTFGPTRTDIQSLTETTLPAWIDAQMALPESRQLSYVKQNSNGSDTRARHYIWWRDAVTAEDQLRQRMAFALSQLFVISDLDYTLSNSQYGMASYYDTLLEHAFGSYRELLEAITLHPTMGIYLSHVRNEKADSAKNIRPDENYAREVLQLFSIGLHRLDSSGLPVPAGNPEPVYTQSDVENFARVFTGWNFDNTDVWQSTDMTAFDKEAPLVPWEEYHDTDAKMLLDGATLAGGQNTRGDLEAALDVIANHPNVGPFIGRQLIQRFVTSNPSPEYVQRVAAVFDNNGEGARGDLGAVLRAILLDPEARNPDPSAGFGKLREPLLRLTQLFRAFDAVPGSTSDNVFHPAIRSADAIDDIYGQAVMSSPSVFNFYYPDNPLTLQGQTGTGLVSPELQILTEANVAGINNDLHTLIYDNHQGSERRGRAARIDLRPLNALLDDTPESVNQVIDQLELLMLGGSMSNELRLMLQQHLCTALVAVPDSNSAVTGNPIDNADGSVSENTGMSDSCVVAINSALSGNDNASETGTLETDTLSASDQMESDLQQWTLDSELVEQLVLDAVYVVAASPEGMTQR